MNINNFYISRNRNEYPLQISCLLIYFICDVNMTSLSRKIKWITGKFFKMITKEDFWLKLCESKDYGARWLIREFLDKKGNEKYCWEFCKMLVRLIMYEKRQTTHIVQLWFLLWKNRESKPHTHICLPGGYFEHTLWLSICFLCTFELCVFNSMLDAVVNLF